MMITALFLGSTAGMQSILANVQFSSDSASLCCGVLFLLAVLLLRAHWGFQCPTKQLVFWYGGTLTVYAALSLALNPHVNASACEEYNANSHFAWVVVFAWLQSSAALMLLVLQYMFVYGPKRSPHRPLTGLGIAGACFAIGLLPALLAVPNTINEVCEHNHHNKLPLRLNVAWSILKLAAVAVLAVALGIARQRKDTATLESESESDGTDREDSEGPDSEDTEDRSDWYCSVPHSLLLSLVTMNAVKVLTQVVNAALVSFEVTMNSGSFASMLMLETILEHSQMVILFVSLFFSENFTAYFSLKLPRICPLFYSSKDADDTGSVLNQFALQTIEDP